MIEPTLKFHISLNIPKDCCFKAVSIRTITVSKEAFKSFPYDRIGFICLVGILRKWGNINRFRSSWNVSFSRTAKTSLASITKLSSVFVVFNRSYTSFIACVLEKDNPERNLEPFMDHFSIIRSMISWVSVYCSLTAIEHRNSENNVVQRWHK